jgi:hypothetical protein
MSVLLAARKRVVRHPPRRSRRVPAPLSPLGGVWHSLASSADGVGKHAPSCQGGRSKLTMGPAQGLPVTVALTQPRSAQAALAPCCGVSLQGVHAGPRRLASPSGPTAPSGTRKLGPSRRRPTTIGHRRRLALPVALVACSDARARGGEGTYRPTSAGRDHG